VTSGADYFTNILRIDRMKQAEREPIAGERGRFVVRVFAVEKQEKKHRAYRSHLDSHDHTAMNGSNLRPPSTNLPHHSPHSSSWSTLVNDDVDNVTMPQLLDKSRRENRRTCSARIVTLYHSALAEHHPVTVQLATSPKLDRAG
jgi:hypothetical protein